MNRKRHINKTVLWAAVGLAAVTAAAFAVVSGFARRADATPAYAGGYPVHISEVMTYNTVCPNADGVLCDWVELVNTSGGAFDLTGYHLSDEAGTRKYTFPADSVIPAGGYLVVWCAPEQDGDAYAAFALKRAGGETVCLMNGNGVTLDAADTVACEKNESLVRQADGTLLPSAEPTPGYPNTEEGYAAWLAVLATRAGGTLELSECMTANTLYPSPDGVYCDWIEVHNPSDSPVSLGGYKLSDREGKIKYTFPEGQMLGAGEYLVVWCDPQETGALYAPFALARAGGETVVLTGPENTETDSVLTPALERDAAYAKVDGVWTATEKATPGFANTEAGYAAYRESCGVGDVGIVINEVMAKNQCTLADEDGDFSDWIELTNTGAEPVSLEGWYLSDSLKEPNRWKFPAVTLSPGEYLVVFASGKNRTGGELHTNFALAAAGEAAVLTTPKGAVYASVEYTDMAGGHSLARREDGTWADTAWATPGQANTPEGYAALAEKDARTSPLVINEAMVSNSTLKYQENVGYSDWVELKNVSGSDIELADYRLTDKGDQSVLWDLPAGTLAPGETVLYYCSGDESLTAGAFVHTNFALNAAGETLYLLKKDGTLCDWVFLHDIPREGSCGRLDGENGFFYFTAPTPGGDNANGVRMVAAAPTADVPAGVYNGVDSLTVTLSGEGEIRYTTDGSTPTADSALYTGPIAVTETSVLRAACFPDAMLMSPVTTLSYIVNENHTLPVLSLVTDDGNLNGPKGIYSNNEQAWAENWEREASLSFFEEGGGFTVDCGIQIHGQTSRRASDKKSFKVEFRGRYGTSALHYDIFGDGKVTEFTSLLLRASLEDNYTSYMRDELFADLAMTDTAVPAQNYRYAVLYINGEYWGIYAIREHLTADYFAGHYGVDAATVDRQNGTYRRAGTWSDLMSYAENHDMSAAENYQYMADRLDIPEVIEWLILECYSGNIDVYGNVRFFASPGYDSGKYLYALTDMDLTMMSHGTYSVGFDATGQLHGIIPCALLSNADFRAAFLARLGEMLRTTLSAENVCGEVDKLSALIQAEVPRDLARWGQPDTRFTSQVKNIKDYAGVRVSEMAADARTFFGMTDAEVQQTFGDLG